MQPVVGHCAINLLMSALKHFTKLMLSDLVHFISAKTDSEGLLP